MAEQVAVIGSSIDVIDSVLTIDEVARDLRCSKAHVHNIINGKVLGITPLPVLCLGRRRLVRRSTLEAWKRKNERSLTGVILTVSSGNDAVGA
jgi:excisionase family DNA binding protein